VGLQNFQTMFSDKLFWQALKVTSIFTFVSVPLGLIISFATALLLNTKVRGLAVFRTIYYLPNCSLGSILGMDFNTVWHSIQSIILGSQKLPGCNNRNGPCRRLF
jgi:multiple sugar transport system permease protein